MSDTPKFPIIELDWADYTTKGGWSDRLETEEFCSEGEDVYRSVGYLIDKDEDRIIIAEGVAPNGDLYDLTRVPISQIRGMTMLRGLSRLEDVHD